MARGAGGSWVSNRYAGFKVSVFGFRFKGLRALEGLKVYCLCVS